jgi:integrase
VSLKQARILRDDARDLLKKGVDPSENRKAQHRTKEKEAANSFELVAREWLIKFSKEWTEKYRHQVLRLFERDIFPWIGARPISEITANELLTVIQKIESREALETAHRALSNCSAVMRYAVSTVRAVSDPCRDLEGALAPVKVKHLAAITDPEGIAALLRAIDGYKGTPVVCCAFRLAPLVFVRPGELRHAKWAEFDLNAAEWRYLVSKTQTQHIVPLCSQALAILREIQPLTGKGQFVFPCARGGKRPMSDNAILAAMRRMGIPKEEMCGHGFRAAARTILDEVLKVRPDFIEHQLAHAVRDANGRAYNRTAHLLERHKMMQQWADYLDNLKS